MFFYGNGDRFRQEWMETLIAEPSHELGDVDFVVAGTGYSASLGRARLVGDVPFNDYRRMVSASRLSLSITRRAHASVYASSTCRIFELAACGAAIVSSPHAGMERWFEPGAEIAIVSTVDQACETYRGLLSDPSAAEAMGRRARERVLAEHTYTHRAQRLLELLGI